MLDVFDVQLLFDPQEIDLLHEDVHHHLAQLGDVWTLLLVGCHAPGHNLEQHLAVEAVFREGLVLSVHDVLGYGERIIAAKGLLQSHQLVNDATERPDIRLVGVRLALDDLRATVEDGADETFHDADALRTELLREAKVSQLDVEVRVDEDVRRSQVAVHDTLQVM